MTSNEEQICMLLDSYWYKHQVLIKDPPTVDTYNNNNNKAVQSDWMKKPRDEMIALMIMDCRNDVEVKGLLRFWAHSVASTVS
ncbi:hypothetical protein Hanom_Chr17g01550221 [Helianthus anomalus]